MDYGPLVPLTRQNQSTILGLHYLAYDNELVESMKYSSAEEPEMTSNLALLSVEPGAHNATWSVAVMRPHCAAAAGSSCRIYALCFAKRQL